MPCSDITDYLELSLNPLENIRSFRLRKLSCGKSVGNDLLSVFLEEKPAAQVLSESLFSLIPEENYSKETLFLFYKQLFALQAALAVYMGEEPGYQVSGGFELENIEHDASGVTVRGYLLMDHVRVEEIRACGHCGCSKKNAASESRPLISLASLATKEKNELSS